MTTFLKIVVGVIFASLLDGFASVGVDAWVSTFKKPMDMGAAQSLSTFIGIVRAGLLAVGLWLPFWIWKDRKKAPAE